MNPNSPLTIYGMSGPMGSGKTTLALKIAKETGALFQSLDGVYHWTMSKEEFDSQDPTRKLPSLVPGLKLIRVTE